MKKIILSLLAASASWASAFTVALSSAAVGPTVFNLSNDTIVPNGSLIRIGMLTNAADPSTFVEFGTSTVKNAGIGVSAKPGKVNGSILNNGGEADDAQFNSQNIYVWIYNAADAASATQRGLFQAVGLTFPIDDPASPSDSQTVTATSLTAYINDPTLAIQGRADFSAGATDANGTGRLILGGVPEPTSVGLLALAGLMTLRRRR